MKRPFSIFTAEDFKELMGPGQGGPAIDTWCTFTSLTADLLAQQANRILNEPDAEFIAASRNQREGELAALRVAVEALEKPYICSVCGDRSKEKCGRVCDGDESSCCKYFLNFDQALAQITKLMGEGK